MLLTAFIGVWYRPIGRYAATSGGMRNDVIYAAGTIAKTRRDVGKRFLYHFYTIWEKEADAAVKASETGAIYGLYKVAGNDAIVAILDVPSADHMDRVLHNMPIWRLGYAHLVRNVRWTALRPYEAWAADLKHLVQRD